MKKISILGSTGSIGTQALEVIRQHPDQFEVIALSAHRNIKLLIEQINEFHPDTVCISDSTLSEDIKTTWGKCAMMFFMAVKGFLN